MKNYATFNSFTSAEKLDKLEKGHWLTYPWLNKINYETTFLQPSFIQGHLLLPHLLSKVYTFIMDSEMIPTAKAFSTFFTLMSLLTLKTQILKKKKKRPKYFC